MPAPELHLFVIWPKALFVARRVMEDLRRETEVVFEGRARVPGDDEKYLAMLRRISRPGVASPADVLRFASRLRLYPATYAAPFCGKFESCTFEQAVDLAGKDPDVRFAAFSKIPAIVAFGGGRGAALDSAAHAYAEFLRELAACRKKRPELVDMLRDADEKLNVALEEAREGANGGTK